VLELRPFTGHVVAAERAHRVVAPPYDALDPAARAALAATDPDSYLGALPPGTAADPAQLGTALATCRRHLAQLFAAGRYRALPGPAMGVLTFDDGTARAVAIVADVPVSAFAALTRAAPGAELGTSRDDGLVRPHEQVQTPRVDALARYLEVVGVASSPVALTQRPSPEVTAATSAITSAPPSLAYRAEDGVDVALWCTTDPVACRSLASAVAAAGPAFLADGHHRGAAAVRHAAQTGAGPDDAAGRVLCAILPSDHLTVHPFHRRFDGVLEPDVGDGASALLTRLRDAGVVITPAEGPHEPGAVHRIGLTAAGGWWHLDVAALGRDDDLVESLDVRLVERDLAPLITAGQTDPLPPVPVPAPLGLDTLVRPGSVGLALHPPDVTTVLAVADAGGSLPPKTTYVTPKLRSGLIVTPRHGPAAAADGLR
jgi:uncharacterized protein (DUF1015 family)